MTTILAIDSSTGPCSVALWHKNRIAAYVENLTPAAQAANLMPMVEKTLQQSGLSYSDLTIVAATAGPGSFTGIRVGLASARSIAFAANIQSAGYTTLDVLAYAAKGASENILSILNAGKGEYYYQCNGCKPQLGSLEQALAAAGPAPVTVAGNAAIDKTGFTHCGVTFPRADALAALAADTAIQPQTLRPYYIRPPDAKLPKQYLTNKII